MATALLFAFALGSNLLVNPGFGEGTKGWSTLWSRTPNTATAKVVGGRNGGRAIRVVQSAGDDWSFSQAETIPVVPRQLYQIAGWMKSADLNHAELSVVTRDAKGVPLNWSHGLVGTSGTHDWKRLARRFVIPDGCATIQFRMIGVGKGEVLLQDPSLSLLGTVDESTKPSRPIEIMSGSTRLKIQLDGSMEVSQGNLRWNYRRPPEHILVRSVTNAPKGAGATIAVWDAESDLDLKVRVTPASDGFRFVIDGQGQQSGNMAFPGPLDTRQGQWLIVPMNEGILFPVDEAEIPGTWLVAYGGHGISMPWYGHIEPKSGSGAMTILETPDDAAIQVDRFGKKLLTVQNQFEPSRGEFAYPRSFRLAFTKSGGYVSQAKLYRRIARSKGLLVTLREKAKRNPHVDKLIGAINVWNWDMDKVALSREMKGMGMDRVLWSGAGDKEQIRQINDLGFLTSRYDIYQDIWDPKNSLPWQPTSGWPDDLVLQANGDWMKGWSHPEKQPDGTTKWYQGGVICSSRALDAARKKVPADLNEVPFTTRFIDTTTASPWRECYNPKHPLNRSQDRQHKMRLLEFMSKDMNLVTGTETGIDRSLPFVHYYEGMLSLGPYRLPDSGTEMMAYRKPTPDFLKFQVGHYYRIPLWELVYHDCTVAQWYWGDASNKAPEVWNRRDLLNVLYGTAPLVMFDKAKWQEQKGRILQTYKDVCENVRRIGYDEMLSHEFLTEDHTLQRTRWSSGRETVVNYGGKPITYRGRRIPPRGFQVL